jgi:hypothetical protein
MSSYSGPVAPAGPVPQSRPATLTAGFWLSVVSGTLSLLSGLVMIVAGKASVHAFALAEAERGLGSDSTLAGKLADEAAAQAYHSVVTKAVVGILLAVAVLAFAYAARGGALWARVALTVALVAGICGGSGLQLGDRAALPAATVALAALVPLLGVVAIVTLFLPATNRYAAARRAAR